MLIKKLSTGIAVVGLLATSITPAFAADVEISGNGNQSSNNVLFGTLNVNAVSQSNKTVANTVVVSNANTGGNTANGNTGTGDVTIETGAAKNKTEVSVTGGDNTATLPDPCGCVDPVDSVLISGNGNKSVSNVAILSGNINLVEQKSKTKANTVVTSNAETGKNKANNNTGAGNKSVTTGKAVNKVKVTVTGGSNSL